ncbi:hypothetical protein [Moorena producens]|nr:hypothetical protein [Moorena producens]
MRIPPNLPKQRGEHLLCLPHLPHSLLPTPYSLKKSLLQNLKNML